MSPRSRAACSASPKIPTLAAAWGAASRAKASEWTPDRGAAKWVEAFTQILAA